VLSIIPGVLNLPSMVYCSTVGSLSYLGEITVLPWAAYHT